MRKIMKVIAWYNVFLLGLVILWNVKYLLMGSEKFKVDVLLMGMPALIFMISFLRGQRIFMKILAWYTLIFGTWSLLIYIVHAEKSIWTLPVVILLTPIVIFPILYFLSRRMDVEDQLEKFYLNMFKKMGISSWQSKIMTKRMLKQCKEVAKREGTIGLPLNYGDVLLEKEQADEKIKFDLSKKRKEGVNDQDIKHWWNQHDLARRMMLAVDDLNKTALVMKLIEKDKMSTEDGIKRLRKFYAIFGDTEDTSHTSGDDRPLPYELKLRIIEYSEKRNRDDKDKYKEDMEDSSSYNALVRQEIRAGNL
jgi:hypothetical protein